jgi:peroxiredoxin
VVEISIANNVPDYATRKPTRTMRTVALAAIILLLILVRPVTGQRANYLQEIDWGAHKFAVVFFIMHDCPICNSYVLEMNRIAVKYGGGGFSFIAAYADSDFSVEEAQKHAREYRFEFPFVLDSDHQLSTKTGTKIVPEAVVFNSKREVLYRGRIDDLYPDIGTRRAHALESNLRDALDDIAAGHKPRRAVAPGAGCLIERKGS